VGSALPRWVAVNLSICAIKTCAGTLLPVRRLPTALVSSVKLVFAYGTTSRKTCSLVAIQARRGLFCGRRSGGFTRTERNKSGANINKFIKVCHCVHHHCQIRVQRVHSLLLVSWSVCRSGRSQCYHFLKKDIEILEVSHKLKGGNPWIPWFQLFLGIVR
jgi:hypothetical protein